MNSLVAVPTVVTWSPEAIGLSIGRRLRSVLAFLRRTGGHGLWIVIWSGIGWLGLVIAPFLVENQAFVLMMLAPRTLFVALASDSVGLVTFVALGTLRLSVTDASYFILGRRFPPPTRASRERSPSSVAGRVRKVVLGTTDRLCRWLCACGVKAGAVLFVRPNARYMAVAGCYGVKAWVAGWTSIAGTILYLVLMHLGVGALL